MRSILVSSPTIPPWPGYLDHERCLREQLLGLAEPIKAASEPIQESIRDVQGGATTPYQSSHYSSVSHSETVAYVLYDLYDPSTLNVGFQRGVTLGQVPLFPLRIKAIVPRFDKLR